MQFSTLLDQLPVHRRSAAEGVAVETSCIHPGGLSDLVTSYPVEHPKTEWVRRLRLSSPRENLRCLPTPLRLCKRCMDVSGALMLLLACAPLMVLAAVLVKLSSPGPVIYRQTRVGLNLRSKKKMDRRCETVAISPDQFERRTCGSDRREENQFGQPFTIYKFRTMRNDAEQHGARFAVDGDDRVTPVGRILRRTRIDELPQLWNVLKGQMSLVGPRPERPEFMRELSQQIPSYLDRLGLKPGLTGLAQVVNGYDNELTGFRRKVGYDLLYLQNCCLINDLKILLRTIRVVITGEGAV